MNDRELGKAVEACAKDIRNTLKREAIQILFYLAAGPVMRRKMATKHGIHEDMVGRLLDANAINLEEYFRKA